MSVVKKGAVMKGFKVSEDVAEKIEKLMKKLYGYVLKMEYRWSLAQVWLSERLPVKYL
ncbi:DUF936 domain-containing protein [Salmonella enterica]|nr:DUF936 domain-containing protein [Salmonella enterica]